MVGPAHLAAARQRGEAVGQPIRRRQVDGLGDAVPMVEPGVVGPREGHHYLAPPLTNRIHRHPPHLSPPEYGS
eukprot:8297536-Pyramimonas_sp.AAC.2